MSCGVETVVPPWTRGDFRGVLSPFTHPGGARHPSKGAYFHEE